MTSRRRAVAVALLAVLLLLPSGLYFLGYWRLPNDGTVIDLLTIPDRPGLVVQSIRPSGALQTGDVVVGVDGQSIDAVVSQALRHAWRTPATVDTVEYDVVRAGEPLSLRQALRPTPLWTVVGQNWTTFFFLAYLETIGLLVFFLRPRQTTAQLLLIFSCSLFTSSVIFFLGLPLSGLRHGWMLGLWLWGAIAVYAFLAGNAVHFSQIFPRPWYGLSRRPVWIALLYAAVWLPMLAHMAWGWTQTAAASARLLLAVRASSTTSVLIFPLVVASNVANYRRTLSQAERRQLRWVMWGAAVAILPWATLTALPQALGLQPILPPLVVGLLWCALPTAFAISILREGLFDIDVIIHRSLVYGALTVVLALAYFGVVVVLQGVLRAFTGGQQDQLATVLSTLTIAALFSPLRQRLQRSVDRRFYRHRYDATRTLAAFGATMRDEVDLSTLSMRLQGAVQDTMQPAHSWLWLRPVAGRDERADERADE